MRRMAVAYATESLGLSERKACGLIRISPSVYRYKSRRCDDSVLRSRMRELAGERERFGSPRVAHHAEERGPGGQPQAYGAHL